MMISAGARPLVTAMEAAEMARELFGVSGEVSELGSQQDRNYRIRSATGDHVLKIANAATPFAEVEAQNTALHALASSRVTVAAVIPGLDSEFIQRVELSGVGEPQVLQIRLLTFVAGRTLAAVAPFTREHAAALGRMAAQVSGALAQVRHPGLDRETQWDLRRGAAVVDSLLKYVSDPPKRELLRTTSRRALTRLADVAPELREQPIHGDLTDDNVIAAPEGSVDAVIDFGDVAVSWLVAEIAVTCASILHRRPDEPLLILDAIEHFTRLSPLTDEEAVALWPLIVLRTAVLVVSGEHQVVLDGDNSYAEERRAGEWLSFAVAEAQEASEMEHLIRWTVRSAGSPQVHARPVVAALLVPGITAESLVDLSVMSPLLDEGRWLESDIEGRLLAAVAERVGVAITRYGEFRLTRSRVDTASAIPTLALGVEISVPVDTAFFAPFPGTLTQHEGNWWSLDSDGVRLWICGLVVLAGADGTVRAVQGGEILGSAASVVRVQLSVAGAVRPPFFVRPAGAKLWRELCPDPSALFGLDAAAPVPRVRELLDRRNATFAQVQEVYYDDPPQIERGWKHHLIDIYAQTYVDMVNNVATVGHAHPRLVEAVDRQWRLLNTNSRFHYEQLAHFSARLAEIAPPTLDTVFLVNSGSEAVDLALRLAQVHTGRSLMLATREAYHGWTVGADAVSSSLGDNPRALETRPDWVHLIESPHSVKGKYRGDDAATGYLSDLDVDLAFLAADGRSIAGFIAEPVFGNAGGVVLPAGYLTGVYGRIRALGGVCISDEIQVGYGRLGQYFWGCEQQGVMPDIITVAKAMGNGHPLGAVITTREIADSFAREGSFFSSAGGSPVSCRVGLTVLDIMRDESLQNNAAVVGAHLRDGLERLALRHEEIGAVYGLGLYLGVELVADRATFQPDAAAARFVCESLRREGCIMQPTGDYKNVLKIKPPLCVTRESVDHFVDSLDRVLRQWKG